MCTICKMYFTPICFPFRLEQRTDLVNKLVNRGISRMTLDMITLILECTRLCPGLLRTPIKPSNTVRQNLSSLYNNYTKVTFQSILLLTVASVFADTKLSIGHVNTGNIFLSNRNSQWCLCSAQLKSWLFDFGKNEKANLEIHIPFWL